MHTLPSGISSRSKDEAVKEVLCPETSDVGGDNKDVTVNEEDVDATTRTLPASRKQRRRRRRRGDETGITAMNPGSEGCYWRQGRGILHGRCVQPADARCSHSRAAPPPCPRWVPKRRRRRYRSARKRAVRKERGRRNTHMMSICLQLGHLPSN